MSGTIEHCGRPQGLCTSLRRRQDRRVGDPRRRDRRRRLGHRDVVDGAPWYGVRKGKDGVGAFFDAFGKAMDVEDFTPLTFAATDDGDVLTVVRFATFARETGKLAKMHLHHWFRFTNGKISYYRGTEDTARIPVDVWPVRPGAAPYARP